MGNCQAAEASAAVVIVHPGTSGDGRKAEMIYWSVSAHEIMNANPGHYVAAVVVSPARQLRLLRPADTLHVGHVYRLVSFEDVLKEFATTRRRKKSVKLGKLMTTTEETGVAGEGKGLLLLANEKRMSSSAATDGGESESVPYQTSDSFGNDDEMEQMLNRLRTMGSGVGYRGLGRRHGSGHGQRKPALQSIAES